VSCTCRDGFAGDGHTCLDIDECAQGTDLCDREHGSCANTEGGYTCDCEAGWWMGTDGTSCLDSVPAAQVASGGGRVCVLERDGSLACWGEHNQWIDPTPPSGTFKQVAVGWYYSCAVRTDGTIACWGDSTGHPPIAPPTRWHLQPGRRRCNRRLRDPDRRQGRVLGRQYGRGVRAAFGHIPTD
jgi:hypothetical protein